MTIMVSYRLAQLPSGICSERYLHESTLVIRPKLLSQQFQKFKRIRFLSENLSQEAVNIDNPRPSYRAKKNKICQNTSPTSEFPLRQETEKNTPKTPEKYPQSIIVVVLGYCRGFLKGGGILHVMAFPIL